MDWTLHEVLEWITNGRFSHQLIDREKRLDFQLDTVIAELVHALREADLIAVGELIDSKGHHAPDEMPTSAWRSVVTNFPRAGEKFLDLAGSEGGAALIADGHRWINIHIPVASVKKKWPALDVSFLLAQIDQVVAVANGGKSPPSFIEFAGSKYRVITFEKKFKEAFPHRELPEYTRAKTILLMREILKDPQFTVSEGTWERWRNTKADWLEKYFGPSGVS